MGNTAKKGEKGSIAFESKQTVNNCQHKNIKTVKEKDYCVLFTRVSLASTTVVGTQYVQNY